MKLFAGFYSHSDYETLIITTDSKDLRGFEYKKAFSTATINYIGWDDERIDIYRFSSIESFVNAIGLGYHDLFAQEDMPDTPEFGMMLIKNSLQKE